MGENIVTTHVYNNSTLIIEIENVSFQEQLYIINAIVEFLRMREAF